MMNKAWSALLLVTSIPIGFIAGAWIGARLFVPENAGLAGGAIVFWYGALATLLVLGAGVVLVYRLDGSHLRAAALISAGLAISLLALVAWVVIEQRAGEPLAALDVEIREIEPPATSGRMHLGRSAGDAPQN